MHSKNNDQTQGAIAAAIAFATWGSAVIFWKQLEGFSSLELIIYRLLAGLCLSIIAIAFRGSFYEFIDAFKDPKQLRINFINGLLLVINWLCYIYAVTHNHILEASLAYFIVPILNTATGFIFLKERLTKLQWIAIALASLGILNEIVYFGSIPWMALVIATTFAVYGMNKSQSKLGPLTSLSMETSLMVPFTISALLFLASQGSIQANFTAIEDWLWIFGTGLITIFPLILFAYGTKRIQLTSIGIFQFLAPSINFLIGVFMYGEAFSTSNLITFILIWIALGVYLTHIFKNESAKKKKLRL